MRDGHAVPNTLSVTMTNVIRARASDGSARNFAARSLITDHYTCVACADGDLMQGVSPEMIALIDDHGITNVGPLTLADFRDQVARFRGHGWIGLAIAARHQQVLVAPMVETKAAARGEPLGVAPIVDAFHRSPRGG
mgnify:FL=1